MAAVQSAVRLPTPPPGESALVNPLKRKARSPSPSNTRNGRPEKRVDSKPSAEDKQTEARKAYLALLEKSRTGGIYVPPSKLKALEKEAQLPEDKNSKEYQRLMWNALKKSINGLINKANTSNLKEICVELFDENLQRGRGLFAISMIQAQHSSLPYSALLASLVCAVTSKLPQVGDLLVKRLASRFQKAFKRNDKKIAQSSVHFVAHLTNQQVVEEKLVIQMLLLLLNEPSDDSVELAVDLIRQVGAFLEDNNAALTKLVFDQLRQVLQGSDISQRTMYAIEAVMQERKEKFQSNPAIPDGLDLIEEEDKYTIEPPDLDEAIDIEQGLNVFQFDPKYEETEEQWRQLRAELLGEGDDSEDDAAESVTDDGVESETEKQQEIHDLTAEELTRLRRNIFLTIQSSGSYEEACHKLLKMPLPAGKERELPAMVIESCCQKATYEKFFGLLGERLCQVSRFIQAQFEEEFVDRYKTIHRYDAAKSRNMAAFFGYLLGTNAIGWHCLSCIVMTEQETTSASRIFIKIFLQGMLEEIGPKQLEARFKDPMLAPAFTGLFPTDHPRNTRFAINYFTSIGLGSLTEGMREHLANLQAAQAAAAAAAPPPPPPVARGRGRSDSASSRSSYSSYSSYSSRSRSDSRSRSPARRRASSSYDSRSPSPRGRRRARSTLSSHSRSRSPRRRSISSSIDSRSRSRSRTSRRRGRRTSSSPVSSSRSRSVSDSRSPPLRRRRRSTASVSRSRSPPTRRTRRGRSVSSASGSRSRSRSPRRRRARSGTSSRSRSRSVSPSRSRSPPPRRAAPARTRSPPRNARPANGGRAPPAPKERSLSPYSKRVALTRGGR